MIYVCDAIMGSGKSQSAIRFMNENPDRRYVYITPYLDETFRIRENCPGLNFVGPSNRIKDYDFTKLGHTKDLLKRGSNITTTHVAFRAYTADMLEDIRRWGYTLVMDEAVDTFEALKCTKSDIRMLEESGFIVRDNDTLSWNGKEYDGGRFNDLFQMLRCNNVIETVSKRGKKEYYCWAMPKEVLCSFKDVYVLTYMFDCQDLKYYLDLCSIPFERIGVKQDDKGYTFTSTLGIYPEYVAELRSKINIFSKEKLNNIGENTTALSGRWLETHVEERQQLKNNIFNFFHNYQKATTDDVLWTTLKDHKDHLKGKGYTKQHVAFNMRATNEYRDRTSLAYCLNVYTQPNKKQFFWERGIEYDEDGYALSTMIQWIWRSAIRDGKEIWIYIPSRRMRELLIGWIEKVTKEAVMHG